MKRILQLALGLNFLFAGVAMGQNTTCTDGTVISNTDTYDGINNPLNSSAWPAGLASITVLFDSNITIDNTITLTGHTIYLNPGVSINILPGCTLELVNCTLLACGSSMWDQIDLADNTATLIVNGSQIQDAEIAVESNNGGFYHIENSFLYNNDVHIGVNPYNGTHNGYLAGSTLSSNNLLNGNTWSSSCIKINQVGLIRIGDPFANLNTIENANWGVQSNQSSLVVQNNEFFSFYNNGNFTSGTAILANGQGNNPIYNILVGGYNLNEKNLFRTCRRGVFARNGLNAVEVVENEFLTEVIESIHIKTALDIDVNYNKLKIYGERGIWIRNNPNADIEVYGNLLEEGLVGILVEQPNFTNPPTVNIVSNKGILQTVLGIKVKKLINANIGQNYVEFNNTAAPNPNGITGQGIFLEKCIDNTVTTNYLHHSGVQGQSSIGIRIEDFGGHYIEKNHIYDANVGISSTGSTNNIYESNRVEDSNNGFAFNNNFSNTTLICNTVRNCNNGFLFGTNSSSTNNPEVIDGGAGIGSANKWDGCTNDIVNYGNATIDWHYSNIANSNGSFVPNTSIGVNLFAQNATAGCNTPVRLGAEQASNSIYPNPSEGMLNISTSYDEASWQVFNLMGQLVYESPLTYGENKINLQHLKAGVYQSRILSPEGQIHSEKIVISK